MHPVARAGVGSPMSAGFRDRLVLVLLVLLGPSRLPAHAEGEEVEVSCIIIIILYHICRVFSC